MTPIRVVSLYADNAGCGDYRVRFPVAAVNRRTDELGVQAVALDHLPGEAYFDGVTADVRRVDVPPGVKVVSFQRPMQSMMLNAILWLKKHRPDIGIVVELDDDIMSIPTSNVAYLSLNPKYSPAENTTFLARSIANCDVLTVSTAELARRYNGTGHQTIVVRNAVPAEMLDNPASTLSRKPSHKELNLERIIGWAGYAGTHGGDLEVTSGALSEFIDGDHVRFRNVGPRDGVAAALGLPEDHLEASGWLSSDLYRTALGDLDIGIVPLADTRFNRSKSALKALEMGAAGVPMIASKLPEFEQLRREGMPVITVKDRRREWVLTIKRLLAMNDMELRDLALQHREFIRRHATVDHRAEEWANAWMTAHRIANLRTTSTRRSVVVV